MLLNKASGMGINVPQLNTFYIQQQLATLL